MKPADSNMLKTTIFTVAFAATIPSANWLIGNVGTVCILAGPCIVPVGFGLSAPSGVLMIGLALVLRDMVQEAGGVRAALVAIGIGAMLSWFIVPPTLVIASTTAFLFAELADLAVYTPLRRKQLGIAVFVSGLVGSLIDSTVFLWLAFGSLDYFAGNVIGKAWMSLAALPVIWLVRARLAYRINP